MPGTRQTSEPAPAHPRTTAPSSAEAEGGSTGFKAEQKRERQDAADLIARRKVVLQALGAARGDGAP